MCILAVPVQRVLRLHLELSQKIAVCFVFLLGSFVCFASLYRIITIVRLAQTRDISWAKSDVFIWSSVEPSVGIISGCLPTLRPLMLYVMRWVGIEPSTIGAAKVSAHGGRPGDSTINPLETISQKRTRKMKRDILDITTLGDEEEGGGMGPFSKDIDSSVARSEDEICLTKLESPHRTDKGLRSDWKQQLSGEDMK
jgi:hypothetical protein